MFKQVTLALAATVLIAGCSSPVKLDQAPVQDRGTSAMGSGANGSGMGQSGVTPVGADSTATAQGPVGVARIVYFDYDSYSVKSEFQSMIEQHARFLKSNPNRRVSLEGNTDARGGSEYNLALGQKRAEAVRRALGLLGVTDSQVEAVSFGAEKPAANGADEASYAQNRRVEFSYR
jgi:peptidoglycan-associated lipoprotein